MIKKPFRSYERSHHRPYDRNRLKPYRMAIEEAAAYAVIRGGRPLLIYSRGESYFVRSSADPRPHAMSLLCTVRRVAAGVVKVQFVSSRLDGLVWHEWLRFNAQQLADLRAQLP